MGEFSDSIKAKLYDFTYTPFMSSVLISWTIINHKYLMIYFSDIVIDKKLILLSQYGKKTITESPMNDSILPYFQFLEMGSHFFWYPVGIGLFYVFGYPHLSNIFYKYTGERNNDKKEIKLAYEKKRAISDEDKEMILLENYTLTSKINEIKIQMSEMDKRYTASLSDINSKNYNLKLHDDEQTKKISSLEKELNEKNIMLSKPATEKEPNKPNLVRTTDNNAMYSDKQKDIIEKFDLDKDTLEVLKTIYKENIKKNISEIYIDQITNASRMARIKVKTIVESLSKKGLIISHPGTYIDLSPELENALVILFDSN